MSYSWANKLVMCY